GGEMMPPTSRFATLVLRAACPAADAQYVFEELQAEYEEYILPERGERAARRWMRSQALRSAGALAAMGLRRSDWEYSLMAILLASAAPPVLMEFWWRFLLSTVPLKADLVRGADFAAISLALTGALALPAGALCSVRGLLLAIPAAWAFSLLGQSAGHSLAP